MSLRTRIADLAVAIRNKLNTMTPRLLPEGGTDGQMLVKKSDSDYDVEWSEIGAWPPIITTGTGGEQGITLPEECAPTDVLMFVKGVFQHSGYTIVGNTLVTTQPAGFEIVIVRYGAGVRGEAGVDGAASIDTVTGLTFALSQKADKNHTHTMDDIDGLQEELNELADQIGTAISDNVTYQYTAPSASNSWTINHNLGRYPSVTVVDSAGTQFYGTVTYLDINTLKVDFLYATDGKAYLV